MNKSSNRFCLLLFQEALCTNQIEMKDLEGTHIDDKGYNSQSSSKPNDKNKGKETKS